MESLMTFLRISTAAALVTAIVVASPSLAQQGRGGASMPAVGGAPAAPALGAASAAMNAGGGAAAGFHAGPNVGAQGTMRAPGFAGAVNGRRFTNAFPGAPDGRFHRFHHEPRFAFGVGVGAPYYDGYPYGDSFAYYGDDQVVVNENGASDPAYCMQRYRSYDPASGTYLGYDGLRHPCP
jgi:hypothetical protein